MTNSLIERRGATVGLITTEGFRDVLEIANELRYDTFDLAMRRPPPLVPRQLRLTVEERIGTDGDVVRPLDLEQVAKAARRLVDAGAEAIAVCFLNSYTNEAHETAAIERILEDHRA